MSIGNVNDYKNVYAFSAGVKAQPELTAEESEYANKLNGCDPKAPLDGKETEKEVNTLGQTIFDQFKNAAKGTEKERSAAAKLALQNICNSLVF